MTYLGLRPLVLATYVAVAAVIGVGLVALTPARCAVVEAGPTGPEPDVTLGRIVEACADGTYRTTTYLIGTGEVVEVDEHDGPITSAELAELAERIATIRAERSGGRWRP